MKLRHAAALGAATSLALVSPALGAAVPTDVEVGGSGAQAKHPITATSIGNVGRGPENSNKPGVFAKSPCRSMSLPPGSTSTVTSGPSATSIISIANARFECDGYNVETYGRWSFKRTAGTPTSAQDDVVRGRVFGIRIVFREPFGPPRTCTYSVAGTATATFDESTQILHIDEKGALPNGLTLTKERRCGSHLIAGARFALDATLQISSPDGPINAVS